MQLSDNIKEIALETKDDIIAVRRYLHKNPELSFKEYNTSVFIKEYLDKICVDWVPIANTGVLATIHGSQISGKVVALRADMDALPIQEETNLDFKSINKGVMHACGHDVHTASLLGVAQILKRLEKEIDGTVKLIFQPAEEILPGGAVKILQDDAFLNPKADIIIGQHVMPYIESGKIGIRKGKMMASMDEIRIKVIGKGGHGAQPNETKDPVVAASTIIVMLQQIISRNSDPRIPSVLSFGKINANGSTNIIPDTVYLEGTFRTLDENWRERAHEIIRTMTASIATGLGCTCEIDIRKGYPHLHNHEGLTREIQFYMKEYLGAENVIETDIWMASEDFAYYGQHADSCFYLLGAGFPDKTNSGLHTSTLEINENCIDISIGLMSYLTIKTLNNSAII